MQIFTRTNIDRWPYAASSAGPYRGILAKKYPCWDAHGPAREMFMAQITGKIKHCLEQCLTESDSFVGYSLFMVGKSSRKTKPCVMIVSDNPKRRKAAFQLIKSKRLMDEYPGFELGYCSLGAEFEDLRQLGRAGYNPEPTPRNNYTSDSEEPIENVGVDPTQHALPLEVCGPQVSSWAQPFTVGLHMPFGNHTWSATCGAPFRHQGQLYSSTVLHSLQGSIGSEIADRSSTIPSASSSDSDECEITGMEDWDDEEESSSESLTITSIASSRSPFEQSDSEDDQAHKYDSQSSSGIRTPEVAPIHVATSHQV
ncbi:hypothetical protein RRF57_001423 [Xylaria bambusicola]|uniref:Uncharacterized protein n=1 Tax=Xylaria bambusicola TaxID=326684 RepID=A0AAN7UDT2_9PEZI